MIVNLTPHEIVIVRADTPNTVPVTDLTQYVLKRILPSGTVARLETFREKIGDVDGIPLFRTRFGKLTSEIKEEKEKYYIVSMPICFTVRRKDFLAPDTSPGSVVRDMEGNIIGVKGLMSCE